MHIKQDHEKIHQRLIEPRYLEIRGLALPNGYEMYVVNRHDIPFTLPSLFIWVTINKDKFKGVDSFNSIQTFYGSSIIDLPICNFKDTFNEANSIIMISPNLTTNRTFLDSQNVTDIMRELNIINLDFKKQLANLRIFPRS